MYDKIKNTMCFTYKVLIAVCLVLMVAFNVLQVLCRYFISFSVIWAEDAAIYLLHWAVCFAMPLLWLMHEHMVMDIANNILPKKVLVVLDYIIDVVGCYFGVIYAYKSYRAAVVNKGYVMSIIGYDEMWRYIPYLISGILLTIAAAMSIYERSRDLVVKKGEAK